MSAEMLRTPSEWCNLRGLLVVDPDGWRDGTRDWSEPITEAEFRRRFIRCTVRYDAVARAYVGSES